MRSIIELRVDDIMPTAAEVLESQGMAGRSNIPARITTLLDSALEIFQRLASPKGLIEDLPISGFEPIYNGTALNSPECPVPSIVAKADAVALFAASMGQVLADKCSELFAGGGPALGYMLDAVNSVGAEQLGRMMCRRFLELAPDEIKKGKAIRVQYYCPGHCGWHLSGQERIFEDLRPEDIGITLTSTWVMHPVKSISGVLVAGGIEIHRFSPSFSFCPNCKEHKCVPRLKLLENTNSLCEMSIPRVNGP